MSCVLDSLILVEIFVDVDHILIFVLITAAVAAAAGSAATAAAATVIGLGPMSLFFCLLFFSLFNDFGVELFEDLLGARGGIDGIDHLFGDSVTNHFC